MLEALDVGRSVVVRAAMRAATGLGAVKELVPVAAARLSRAACGSWRKGEDMNWSLREITMGLLGVTWSLSLVSSLGRRRSMTDSCGGFGLSLYSEGTPGTGGWLWAKSSRDSLGVPSVLVA